jgi:hypothetical protein
MMLTTVFLFALTTSAFAGNPCGGISCGVECCDRSTQVCYTPPGFSPSKCVSRGRSLAAAATRNPIYKDLRTGCVNIVSNETYNSSEILKAIDGLVVRTKIINGSSSGPVDANLAQFLQPGTVLDVFVTSGGYDARTLNSVSNMNRKQRLSKIPFCPIANGNVLDLTVSISSFSVPPEMGYFKLTKSRLDVLASVINNVLDIIVAKADVINGTCDYQAILGDS